MKTFKRVLICTLSFIIIFTILCTSVFAGSPEFIFTFPGELTGVQLYAPYSNLESIVVRGMGPENYPFAFYSLSSPYSLYEHSLRDLDYDGVAPGTEFNSSYNIGTWRIPYSNGNLSPFSVSSKLTYLKEIWTDSPGYMLDKMLLNDIVGNSFFDVMFTYSNSALPYAYENPYATGGYSPYPFWPVYEIRLSNLSGDTLFELPPVKVTVTGKIMAFVYEYSDESGYHFSTQPYYKEYTSSLEYDLVLDAELSTEYGYSVFSPLKVNLFDIVVPWAQDAMVDNTLGDDPTLESYCVYDKIDIRFEFYPNDEQMFDWVIDDFSVYEYFCRPDRLHVFKLPPDISSVNEYFSTIFPVYSFPDALSELSFIDFLESVMSIFEIELIGTFSLSDLLFGVAGIGLLIWFIKMFAGG